MTPHFPVVWQPYSGSDPTFLSRLQEVLESWGGTPYRPGQQCKQVGTDCVRFALAVVDEMRGDSIRRLPSVPSDAAWHHAPSARAGMRRLIRMYLPFSRVPISGGLVEPGDLLVCGPPNGGPAHLVVVGTKRNTLWQATSYCVAQTGWSLGKLKLMRIFRSAEGR